MPTLFPGLFSLWNWGWREKALASAGRWIFLKLHVINILSKARRKSFWLGRTANSVIYWWTPKKVHLRNSVCRLCGDILESRHLRHVFRRAGKASSDKNLASKIRNVCGIIITEKWFPFDADMQEVRLLWFVTFVHLLFSVWSLNLFVASLVFMKGTSCCVIIRNFW